MCKDTVAAQRWEKRSHVCDSLWTSVFFSFLSQERGTRVRLLLRGLPGPPALPEPTSTSDEPSHGAPFQVTAAHWLHWQPRSEAASCFHYIKKKKQKQTNNYKKEIPLITNRRRQWGAEVEQQSPAALRTSAPWRRPLGGWERASLAPWRLPAERRRGSSVWGRQVGPGVVSDPFLKSSADRGLRASRGNLASCLPNLIEKRFSLSPAWTFLFQFVSDTVILLPCTTVRCLSPPSQ